MRNKSVTFWGLRAVRSAREGSAVSFSCISVTLSSNGTLVVRQPRGVTPKSLIEFFSLLIVHPWCIYNEIWGGVEVSPLSNFKYSRWRPIWFPRRKFLLFRCFSASDQPCFGQYACCGFNGWSRNGLRRIVSTVAMVTGNIDNI